MDITDLYTSESHENGAECRLLSPVTGELTDFYIRVVGVDSKTFRDKQREQKREVVKALQNKQDIVMDELDLLVECCIDWRGFESKGKKLKFSKDVLKTLFDNSPYIASQIDSFILNRQNFTQG